jgi:hypothetical protein
LQRSLKRRNPHFDIPPWDVSAIPNLKKFQAIAFGKAIKSERPVIFEIPEDPEKQKASELLNKKWEKPGRNRGRTSDKRRGRIEKRCVRGPNRHM